MFLQTPNGFWIVKNLFTTDIYRTHNFWNPKTMHPAGSKISVSAFTRSGKNITRIPFVINFYINEDNDIKDEENIIGILGQIFSHRNVLMIESYRDRCINHCYIYDDIHLCQGLKINHSLYLKQYKQFMRLMRHFIYSFNVRNFKLYNSNEWIILTDKINYKLAKKPNIRTNYNFFYDVIEKVSSNFNIKCQYIENALRDTFVRNTIEMLSILRTFSTSIECMSLYYMYYNLYLKNKNKVYIKYGLDNSEPKFHKWSCEKDCRCRCGIKSPLHLLAKKDEMDNNNYQEEVDPETGIIPNNEVLYSVLLAFFGSCILNEKKILVNDKRIYLGIFSFILCDNNQVEQSGLEHDLEMLSQDFTNIRDDITLSQILNLRETKNNYNILSYNIDSAFLRSLYSRSPNYDERILSLRAAVPFTYSPYKQGGKLNILQFINTENLSKIFTYNPLKKFGFLGRAIVCKGENINYSEILGDLYRIKKFSQDNNAIVNIKIDMEKINEGYIYNFHKEETVFTKKIIMNFYTSLASILSILFGIINEKIDNKADYLIIDDTIINLACIYANDFLRQRDRQLFYLTKKFNIKNKLLNLLNNNEYEYMYHRDIYRKYQTDSKEILDNFFIKLIRCGDVERWRVNDKEGNNTPIIYRYTKKYRPLLSNLNLT